MNRELQISSDGAAEGWRIGVAYCDNTLKNLGISEFIDSDHLTTLEGVLVRLGAREVIVAEDKVRRESWFLNHGAQNLKHMRPDYHRG